MTEHTGLKRHTNARGKQLPRLSQRGLNRIPHNPKQRVAAEGGVKKAGTTLDAFNDRQEDHILHPTKGWRKLNVRRSLAAMRVAEILAPKRPRPEPKVVADATGSRSKYMPHIDNKERGRYAART